MTFKRYGSSSNSISVKVIDIIGPTITTEPGLPLPFGSNVAFICMVETLSTKISFEWECLGKVEHKSRRVSKFNSTKYSSVIMRNIHLHHDGESCRCHINLDGISGNFEISLEISRKPIIYISKAARCESSSAVTLYCVIHTEFPLFGFHKWIHTRHGKFIRHLEGDTIYTKSIFKFDSCSHDDTGDYTCEEYNSYHDNTTFTNKTVSLLVYALPAFFDLRIVAFGIIAFGIFILTASRTVIMSKGIQRKNVIHITGPNERCPTIPIYHSAPALDNTQNAYDTPETGYLQVINEQYELNHFRDTEIAEEENNTLGSDYDEIDV